MIRINIKFNECGDPYTDNDSVMLKLGQRIEFVFPDGTSEYVRMVNVSDARSITGDHACDACPFSVYDQCPTWSYPGGLSICPYTGYMVKDGSVLECL